MRAAFLVPLLLLQAACWSPRYFTPREHVNGSGPKGHPAAGYAVPAAEPGLAAVGEVRLWSEGARARYDDNEDEVVQVHIGFELENTGDQPLQLELASLQCEEMVVDGLLQAPFAAVRIDGDGYAPPGATARLDAFFQPTADAPRHIEGFSIRFAVLAGERRALAQVTPFGPRQQAVSPSPYYWGAFGPYYGLGWSYGYGYGFGHTRWP